MDRVRPLPDRSIRPYADPGGATQQTRGVTTACKLITRDTAEEKNRNFRRKTLRHRHRKPLGAGLAREELEELLS